MPNLLNEFAQPVSIKLAEAEEMFNPESVWVPTEVPVAPDYFAEAGLTVVHLEQGSLIIEPKTRKDNYTQTDADYMPMTESVDVDSDSDPINNMPLRLSNRRSLLKANGARKGISEFWDIPRFDSGVRSRHAHTACGKDRKSYRPWRQSNLKVLVNLDLYKKRCLARLADAE